MVYYLVAVSLLFIDTNWTGRIFTTGCIIPAKINIVFGLSSLYYINLVWNHKNNTYLEANNPVMKSKINDSKPFMLSWMETVLL